MNLVKYLSLEDYFGQKESEKSFHMDLFIMFLIFIATIIFVLKTYEISYFLNLSLTSLQLAIVIFFVVEIFLRFSFSKPQTSYFFSIYTWIDIIAMTPFLFGESSFIFFRILRFFRILSYSDRFLNFRHILDTSGFQKVFLIRLIFSVFSLIFISSSLMFVYEGGINPNIQSFDDAIYFSLVTVAAVGYGDIVPITDAGRWIMMLIILIAVVMIPWHISTLVRFSEKSSQRILINCSRCKRTFYDEDANYCKFCGNNLKLK